MYLTKKSELARLRAYYDELGDRYLTLLRQHDYQAARDTFDLRRRVRRSILVREEWCDQVVPESELRLAA